MTYHQSTVNEQVMADAIARHITAISNQNRLYGNLFNDISQYNWQNYVMTGLIATGMEAIEVWSATRGVPKETLLNEVVAVISDIQSIVSAKRNHAIITTLTRDEQYIFQQIAATGERLNAEIESYMNRQRPVTGGYQSPYGSVQAQPVNPRYAKSTQAEIRNQPSAHYQPASTETTTTSARYRQTATTSAAQPTPNNNSKRLYVVSNQGKKTMAELETLVYQNHRRNTFSTRPADRTANVDFMGSLAKEISVNADQPGVNAMASEITKLATDVIATCREHAQAIFCASITDAGNTISPDAILEYSYDEVRTVRTVTDVETLRLALLNDVRITRLRDIKDNLGDLATVIAELLNDPVNHLANVVARHLNLAATEQINRFLKYDMELTWDIPDFQAAWPELYAELCKEYGIEVITDALDKVSEDIITKVGTVFTPTMDTDAKLCEALNGIHQRDLAERSIFIMKHVHVTHIPANFSALNLTFEGTECLVDPKKAPELYNALLALETRMDGGMRKFSKILLVTEDEVELEMIPTHVECLDGSDRVTYALKLLKA